MKTAVLLLSLFAATLHAAEPCRVIHGRARTYSGDGWVDIWHIGTHHTFYPVGDSRDELVNQLGWNDDTELIADFTLCPTRPFFEGASQPATIKKISRPRLKRRKD